MKIAALLAPLLLLLMMADAGAVCAPLRIGYIDQHRPPYYIGQGTAVPAQPGASVEIIREISGHAACQLKLTRLPLLRMRAELAAGHFDATAIDADDTLARTLVFPLDKNGKPDQDRALRSYTVVFVRRNAALPADTDPMVYFRDHKLGTTMGSPLAPLARKAGLQLDDGALDATRNLEKLRLGRIDGFAALVIGQADLDGWMRQHHGNDFVRLDKPLRVHHIWLAFNKAYYEANQPYVEAMWQYTERHASERMSALVRKYEALP